MKKIAIALAICLALLLGLCVVLETRPEPVAPTEPVTFTTEFKALGVTLSEQTLTEGATPEVFVQSLPGIRLTGWLDSTGAVVDPFTIPVTADTVYTAVAHPELTQHVPFLFCNEAGLLLPSEELTAQALSDALYALAAPGAENYFPTLPSGEDTVTLAQLTEVLQFFFPAEQVSATFNVDTVLTRSAFAVGMCNLLNRTGEPVVFAEDAIFPADVTAGYENAPALLEASVVHTPAETGVIWEDVELISGYEPGFVLEDGQLYYVKEDGYLLRDAELGTLTFGADGRYTCGDEELDAIVTDLLAEMILQNPEATRFELLRVAYDYCHQTFGYRRSWDDHPAKGSHGWEINRAKDIFTSGKGNCYGFAAAFWSLARGLGYEARAISGVVLADEQPHSWCFIEFDGKDYIFDPQWQFDYTRREIFEYDMFYLPTDNLYFWGYQWFE